ncbi:hypothetical protein [Exiguobacterium sp. K1]|uniref:hypothetical protein n=1 Tax=Exiguobacterium sp. K1 TaxID=2980105 RepID=UPI00299D6C98|nr:hypothetical protein [Exiguobacterium sp. K1]MDX1259621.1 hypothetical protein [Exiguobacterium sp. K1]
MNNERNEGKEKIELSEINKSKKTQSLETVQKEKQEIKTKSKENTGQRTAVPKGTLLEYRLKRLMFYMGYYPRINVILKTSQDETAVRVTDLDVYGIYIHKDFTSKTLWADCKSGNAKSHERISWIKGIMTTFDINNVLFVKNKVRTETKQYARKYGIQVLDLNIIPKLEEYYNIHLEDWNGSWNPYTQHNQSTIFSKISVPTNDIYKKIDNFISTDYWLLDNYSRIKKIVTAIRELSPMLDVPIPLDQSNSIKWAINELVCLFLLTTLNISKELYYFNEREKRETIFESLAAGDVSTKKRKEIFNAAFRVAYSMVKNQIPEFIPPSELPSINLNPPKYTDAFYDLITRITNNPLQYYDLLRFLDFYLMEYDLHSNDVDYEKLKDMFANYDDLIIGAKTLLHFISQITNLPRAYFQILN